ncbi:hypothetical protein NDI52_23095 [Leptolyngbya sp. PL-A3]|uniref:hypothetical protein n=1 Tax=unclassified Leptolyngbya TaxID=2650499 RepID=UPI001A7E34BB|nr:hypothetical protein [Leptolyngbya sp. FACHB-8]
MRGIGSISSKIIACLVGLALLLGGCTNSGTVSVRTVPIQQNWELQPGKQIAGYRVASGLGDISIEVKGEPVYAPFDGLLQPNDIEGCYVYTSPDVPAYLFRLCGLERPRVGDVQQGQPMGRAQFLSFATLRRQPDGKWTMVEPASDVLNRILNPNGMTMGNAG